MRCYLDKAGWGSETVELPEKEAHHLWRVLRLRTGAQMEVFDGAGRTAQAEVLSAGPRGVTLRLGCPQYTPRSEPRVLLVQAVPKGQRMDWLLEKATELGVDEVQPVLCARAVVRPDPKRAAHRHTRWTEIVRSASRQSRRAWLPLVQPVAAFDAFLGRRPLPELLLLGDLGPGAAPLREVLDSSQEGGRPRSVGILIGPEGDFTEEEKDQALSAGARPVHLGDTVLRSETAALYALSAVRYALECRP